MVEQVGEIIETKGRKFSLRKGTGLSEGHMRARLFVGNVYFVGDFCLNSDVQLARYGLQKVST